MFFGAPNPTAVFAASGSWRPFYSPPSTYATYGLVKLDSSTAAQLSLQVAVPSLDVLPTFLYGLLRLETFEFTWPPNTIPFLVLGDSNSSFLACPCHPLNRSIINAATYVGQIQLMGSYSCLFGAPPYGRAIDPLRITSTSFYILSVALAFVSQVSNQTQLLSIMQRALVAPNVSATRTLNFALVGVANLQIGNVAVRSNKTLGLASSYFDPRSVMGIYADIGSFFVLAGIVLLVESDIFVLFL